MLTIDANVFVSSSSLTDKLNAESEEFLRRAGRQELQIYCPTLLLPEVASAIIRPTSDINAARITLAGVENFPNINLVPLTEQRAQAAVQIAINCRLRGADAVYAAVAEEYETTLITWDQELLERGAAAALTMTPTDWLAANPL